MSSYNYRRREGAGSWGDRGTGAAAWGATSWGACRRWQAVRVLVLGLCCAAAWSCADARSKRVRGPDGSEGWHEVTCRTKQQRCHEEARRLCPAGFEVAKNVGRQDVGIDTTLYSGHMLIKCTP